MFKYDHITSIWKTSFKSECIKVVKSMNLYVQQSISIQFLKIGGITNSSVLQIGSAGIIKAASRLYNTGGYTEPAPLAEHAWFPNLNRRTSNCCSIKISI